MTQSRRRAAGAALFLVLAALIGCGKSGPKPAPVSGTVLYDGRPLPEGTVYFKTPQTGSMDALPVKDGKFEGTAEVGDRRVEVTAYKVQIRGTEGMKGEVKESLIPPRYNVESNLTAAVKADGPNTFEFKVTSK